MGVTLYVPQNSIMAILGLSGDKGMANIINGVVMMVISLAGSFVATLFLYGDGSKAVKTAKKEKNVVGKVIAEN